MLPTRSVFLRIAKPSRFFSTTAALRDPQTPDKNVPPHFKITKTINEEVQHDKKLNYLLFQPVYTEEQLNSVEVTHVQPSNMTQRLANIGITIVRGTFDFVTGYGRKEFKEADWLQRVIYLETIAGVPGMVAAMHRHMRSLRTMNRDRGWVHTLLEECENERMHLLTFLQLRQPSSFFRMMVLFGQGIFYNAYFVFYMISPRYCHSFVGYLEEEAVRSYTHLLRDLDDGKLKEWATTPAPLIAKNYWKLKDDAMMKDVFLAIRADEANHRDVNHVLSKLKITDPNPFAHVLEEKPATK